MSGWVVEVADGSGGIFRVYSADRSDRANGTAVIVEAVDFDGETAWLFPDRKQALQLARAIKLAAKEVDA